MLINKIAVLTFVYYLDHLILQPCVVEHINILDIKVLQFLRPNLAALLRHEYRVFWNALVTVGQVAAFTCYILR